MWKYRCWPIAKSAGTSFVLVQKGTRETPTHTHCTELCYKKRSIFIRNQRIGNLEKSWSGDSNDCNGKRNMSEIGYLKFDALTVLFLGKVGMGIGYPILSPIFGPKCGARCGFESLRDRANPPSMDAHLILCTSGGMPLLNVNQFLLTW